MERRFEHHVLGILKEVGAIIENSHFVYTSGRHGSKYINKDALYIHPWAVSQVSRDMAKLFRREGVEVVIAPAIGGILLGHRMAELLTLLNGSSTLSIYAEKETILSPDPKGEGRRCHLETGNFVIRRGYDKLVRGRRVLVAEDVLTTGGSIKGVVEAVRLHGGIVIGAVAICNRGGVTAENVGNVPKLFSLTNITLEDWAEADCPLCKEGVPINKEVGKGMEFMARRES